jgi:hypothetical protein
VRQAALLETHRPTTNRKDILVANTPHCQDITHAPLSSLTTPPQLAPQEPNCTPPPTPKHTHTQSNVSRQSTRVGIGNSIQFCNEGWWAFFNRQISVLKSS